MKNRFFNVLFKSRANNSYYLDEINNQIYLLHPLFYYLLSNHEIFDNKTEELLLKYNNDTTININGVPYKKEEIEYYLNKMIFFKKHGILKNTSHNIFYTNYKREDVQRSIEETNQIVIEMTENCNLRCSYCTYGEMYNRGETRQNRNIDTQFAKEFLHFLITNFWNIATNNIIKRKIRIDYYGGEPLIRYKEIVEITEFLKKYSSKQLEFIFGLTTNATLLNKDILKYLADNNFILTISIDGNKKNNSYRVFQKGEESFPILKKNIDTIKQIYPTYFNNYVYFTSVLHDRNSMEEINNFLIQNYNKTSIVGNLNPDSLKNEAIQKYYNMVNKSAKQGNEIKALKNLIEYYNSYILQSPHELIIDKLIKKRYPSGTCMPLKKKIFITTNRCILPCEKINFKYLYTQLNSPIKKDILLQKVSANHSKKIKKIKKTM